MATTSFTCDCCADAPCYCWHKYAKICVDGVWSEWEYVESRCCCPEVEACGTSKIADDGCSAYIWVHEDSNTGCAGDGDCSEPETPPAQLAKTPLEGSCDCEPGAECVTCRLCCRSKSSIATISPVPTIGTRGTPFTDAVQAALAAMSGVLRYDSGTGHWREYGDPFVVAGDTPESLNGTFRLVLALDCDGDGLYSQVQKWDGTSWTFFDNTGFTVRTGPGTGGDYSATCCVETWSQWRDTNTNNGTDAFKDHTETITVTWTGNTCCNDPDSSTCVPGTIDCDTGDCNPLP